MKKVCKSILSLMLAIVVVLGVMAPIAPVASATTIVIPTHQGNSDMWLVDANTKETASTIYLYGRADYICLKVKEDGNSRGADEFNFAMYSDSSYKKQVAFYSTGSSAGTKYINIPIAFDDLKSGTYYVKTYVEKWEFDDPLNSHYRTKDPDTERKYKIKIVKGGTGIKDMNTVMYGFENTENGPRIYWYSVPGATGYYLYRKSPKTGKYTKIKTVKDSGNKFTYAVDTAMEGKNCTRYYKVAAYKGSSRTPLSLISLKTKILPTPNVSLKVLANNEIRLSWKEIGTRSDYFIYIKGGDIKDWYQIDEVTSGGSNEWIELDDVRVNGKKLKTNTKYYFTVVADVDGVYTGYKTKGVSTWYLNLPKITECTYPETGGVTVNWTESVGADKYRIYRKANVNDDYEYVASVDGSTFSYTDETVTNTNRHYYLIKAYKDDKLVTYGGGKTAVKILAPELVSLESDGDGYATLKWSSSQSSYCRNSTILIKNADGWEVEGDTSYGAQQYSFKLPYQATDVTMTVRLHCDSIDGPYNEEGITLQYRPMPKIYEMYAIAGKGAYIYWNVPKGAENTYVYRKTADSEYELLYTTADSNSFWDTTVEAGVPYTYKIAYSYNGEIVENSALEKDIEYVLGSEKIREQLHVPYSNLSDKYAVKCENISEDISYNVFAKIDGEWKKLKYSHLDYHGQLLLNRREGINEYAISIATPDGKVSMINEPSFVIDYSNQSAEAVTISFDGTKANFTWNPEEINGEEIVVYRNGELIAQIPASAGTYADETAEVNNHYAYKVYVNKYSFLSPEYVFAENEVVTEPEVKVSNTQKGVKITSVNDNFTLADFVVGRKASGGSWKTLDKNMRFRNPFSYVDDTARSGVEYTYRVKMRPVYCDNYGDYDYVTYMFLSTPKIKKITPRPTGLRLYWNEIAGAEKYEVKYYNTETEKWITLKTVSSDTLAFTDTTVQYGEKRTYAVWAINGEYKSSYSKKTYTYLEEPKISSLKSTSSGVQLKFPASEGATGYMVYYKIKGTDKWVGLGPSSAMKVKDGVVTYTHKKVTKGKTYYYKAKALSGSCESTCDANPKSIKFVG